MLEDMQHFGTVVTRNVLSYDRVDINSLKVKFLRHLKQQIPEYILGKEREKEFGKIERFVQKALRLVEFVGKFGIQVLMYLPTLKARYRDSEVNWQSFLTRSLKKYKKELEKRCKNKEDHIDFIRLKSLEEVRKLGYPDSHFPFLLQEGPSIEINRVNFVHGLTN